MNKEKMFENFFDSLKDYTFLGKNEIEIFYKNVCKELFGIKKNWKKSNIQYYIEKLVGFEK